MGERYPFGIPNGWYAVAASSELPRGSVISRRYFDRELAIYRTQSGAVSVVDAFCPHMGAHLGRVGSVEGETIRCGFHGFEYDATGRCVKTAYDGPPPERARLKRWQVCEQNGFILTWFHSDGRAPDWQVPLLPSEGWNDLVWKRYEIATHPQETTENSVDFGHFTQLHGFIDGSITESVHTDGPFLGSSYRAWRPYGFPGRKPFYKFTVDYHVKVWGLGYSQVNVEIGLLGMKVRVFVLSAPTDGENVHLILGAMSEKKFGPFAPLVRRIAHYMLCKEVEQDLDVWTYKKFNAQPALAKGDGPIATYRTWARQFYGAPQG